MSGTFAGEAHDEDAFWRDAAALLPGYTGEPAAPGPSNEDGTWGNVLSWPHIPVSAAILPNGKLLTYSGQERRNWPGTATQTYTAVWDPASETFDEELYLDHEMFCATLVMRSDGVLQTMGGRYTIEHSSVFDFRTNRWSRVDDMNDRRWYTASVALPDGDVFTVSGSGGVTSAERYDEKADRWNRLTGINWAPVSGAAGFESRWWPYLFVAPDGRLFHFGPTETMHWVDPAGTGSRISAGISVPGDHYPKHAGIVMYDAGKILVAGGAVATGDGASTNICYTVDLNTDPPTVALTESMQYARRFGSAVVLPGGEVLMIGGNTSGRKFSDLGSILTAELWDPKTGTWRDLADMSVPRNYHSIGLLLPDGRAIAGGGGYGSNGTQDWHHQDIQIFTPPALFAPGGAPAPRPTISSAPDSVATGSVFRVDATPGAARFAAVRLMATTHGWSSDQRRIDLPFAEQAPGEYRIVAHPSANVMIPGYWMLFTIAPSGAYSEAEIFHVKEAGQGAQAGLLGEYFDDIELIDKQGERIDHEIDFAWGTSSPMPAELGDDTFSARWTGWVVPDFTESHTFYTNSDDGVRLWVDGQLLIDNWTNHPLTENSGSINLSAGQPVAVTLEFYENTGGATMELRWSGARTPKQIVPERALRNSNPAGAASIAANESFEAYVDGTLVAIGSDWRNAYRTAFATNGRATLAIRAWRSGGLAGGVLAEFELAGERVGTSSAWKVATSALGGWTAPGFDDSAWAAATDFGAAASAPWALPEGMRADTPARWIWAADNTGVDEVFLRISFGGPRLGSLGDRANNEEDSISFGIPFSAPAGAALTFSATGLPSGIAIDPSTGLVSGTINDTGEFDPVITVIDGDGESDSGSFHWSVSPLPNTPPILSAIADQANTEGDVITFQVFAFDPDNDALLYLSSGLPTGLNIDSATGLITGVVTATQSSNVTISIFDGRGGDDERNFIWTVNSPLEIVPTPTAIGSSGAEITFSLSPTGGTNPQFRWNFGDGTPETAPSVSSSVSYTFTSPGRYLITATGIDSNGTTTVQTFVQNIHGELADVRPPASSALATTGTAATERVWKVNPDNGTISVFDIAAGTKIAEIAVGVHPRSVAVAPDGRLWVANKRSATISIIDPNTLTVVETKSLPNGSRPHGIVFSPTDAVAFVALEGSGQVFEIDALTTATLSSVEVGAWPRHLSLSADGATVYVSRFISPPVAGEDGANPEIASGGGEIVVLDAATMTISGTLILQQSTTPDSGGGGRGLPNYLGAMAISPDGSSAWIPSKQDNIHRGALRDERDINHENTVRAISSRIDFATGAEDYNARIDHDDGSVPSAALYGPYGLYVFVALEGNNAVAVIDAYGEQELFRFPTGRTPQGLALSADGHTLFVHHFTDRTLGVFDITALVERGETSVEQIANHSAINTETLSSTVLLGKQIFYDASDLRLARDGYISCAACHNEGAHDGRVWDLTGFGEGLRNTIDLRGRAGTAHGPLHWSANFDEVQDFENQIRGLSSGTGLIAGASPHAPMGSPNAGRSADLDALAAYVASLSTFEDSPHRIDNDLTDNAIAGRQIFVGQNCAACHSGQNFTDSGTARHDIGTANAASGGRLGGVLDGFDTPTLRGLHDGAPFLHNGSASTLAEAVAAHDGVALNPAELSQLVAYLQQIDGTETAAPAPATPESGEFASTWDEWLAGGWGASPDADFGDDSESDGAIALLEYAFGQSDTDGLRGAGGFAIAHAGSTIRAMFVRPAGISDLSYSIEVSSDRSAWTTLAITPSSESLNGGLTRWTYADIASGTSSELGYARLRIEHIASATVAYSAMHAWYEVPLWKGFSTFGLSVIKSATFGGLIEASDPGGLSFGQDLSSVFTGRDYYVEILDGTHEGMRFEIDETASAGARIALDLASPDNSDTALPSDLDGARAVVREHFTLGEVLPFDIFAGGLDPTSTDRVLFFDNGAYRNFFALDAGPGWQRWVSTADSFLADAGGQSIAPGRGLIVRRGMSGAEAIVITITGEVRETAFRQRLLQGYNLVASGYPVATGPADRAMRIDNGFFGALDPAAANQFHLWHADTGGGQSGYDGFFLIDGGAGSGFQYWSRLNDSTISPVDEDPLFAPGRACFLRRSNAHPGYRWDAP